MNEALAAIVAEREPWFRADNPWVVRVVAAADGGWDVAVRIDGTYYGRADAEDAAAYMQDRITRAAARP